MACRENWSADSLVRASEIYFGEHADKTVRAPSEFFRVDGLEIGERVDFLHFAGAADFRLGVADFSARAERFHFVNQPRVHSIAVQRTTGVRDDV